MTDHRDTARTPEDLTRLYVERANAGDAEGMAALYEPDAVVAYPIGELTVGQEALRAMFAGIVQQMPSRPPETPLTTLIAGDLALTSTPAAGGSVRAQVARRQSDGSWLRILDRPQFQS